MSRICKYLVVLGVGIMALVGITLGGQRLLEAFRGPEPTPPAGPRPFVIIGEDWAPFEFETEDGVRGIDVELLDLVFGEMDVPYELKIYPWSRAKLMARRGDADAVISVSYTMDREAWLTYTEDQRRFGTHGEWPTNYLWNSEYVFFCTKTFADKITFSGYDQLKRDGYRVGLVRDYSYNPAFREAFFGPENPDCHVAPDIATGFRLLADGKYELFPADRTVGQACIRNLDLGDRITHLPQVLFAKPYLLVPCTMSTFPDRDAIMRRFYHILTRLREDGTYDRIRQRYVGP